MTRTPAILVLLSLVGCIGERGPRATLTPPPPNATFEQRRAAFEQLRALGIGGKKRTFWKPGEIRFLEIADNRRIYEPADLLPVVGPDSASAQAVGEYYQARNTRRLKRNLAWAGMGVGAAMIGGGAAIMATNDKSSGGFFLLGFGVLGVLGATLGLMQINTGKIRFENQPSVERAFKHYDEALARTLRICARGTELVDCDAR
jgi:hypothetical protein